MENLSICQSKDVKKKRKNKKKRRTGPRQKISSEDHENDENEDEVTSALRIVDKMFGTQSSHHQKSSVASHTGNEQLAVERSLLHVQHKNLNAQTELKKMFGKIVNQEQQKRRRAGASHHRNIKSVYMCNPKDTWPPVSRTGLSMNLVPTPQENSEKNVIFFSFEHCKLIDTRHENSFSKVSFHSQPRIIARRKKSFWRAWKALIATIL
jgi:hypothetical protein